jgi:hypothetical protein
LKRLVGDGGDLGGSLLVLCHDKHSLSKVTPLRLGLPRGCALDRSRLVVLSSYPLVDSTRSAQHLIKRRAIRQVRKFNSTHASFLLLVE